MRRTHLTNVYVLLAFALPLLSTVSSHAATLYGQLPGPDSNTAYDSSSLNNFGDTPGYRVADDFTLATTAPITDVHWWGFPSENATEDNQSAPAFTFTFYTDASGLPGTPLASVSGSLSVEPYPFGPWWPEAQYYSSILDTPFSATAGTKYWVSIYNGAVDASWLWIMAESAGNKATQTENGLPFDSANLPDMAFELTSKVPEASTLLLLASGLAGLAGVAWRRVQ